VLDMSNDVYLYPADGGDGTNDVRCYYAGETVGALATTKACVAKIMRVLGMI